MTEKNTTQERLRAVKPFEPTWAGLFCTRDGRPVRIISREGRGEYPVRGYIGEGEHVTDWTARGSYTRHTNGGHPKDLMCAKEVVDLPERWVVYCRTKDSQVLLWSSHTDRESAEHALAVARGGSNKAAGGSFHLYHALPVVLPEVPK